MDPLLNAFVNAYEKQAAIRPRIRIPVPRSRGRANPTAGEGAWYKMFQDDAKRVEKVFKWTRRAGLGAGAAGALYLAYALGKKKGQKKTAGKKRDTVKRIAKEFPLEEMLAELARDREQK